MFFLNNCLDCKSLIDSIAVEIIIEINKTVMSLNDFIIVSKIGEGAYSSVHKVKRVSDGNIYALKKVRMNNLKEKEKENALNEVRLLASINSDFIIKYKESFFDSKSNTLCIVMQLAEGGDLQKLIEKKKKTLSWIDQKQIWTMIKQVLSGLKMLHERNIIHRDIKSANIFISNGIYKVADLNVSKLMKKDLAYTQTGTPYYASPQVWQDKPYEMKSDIWSFGCIVYELCALKPPFVATSMEGLYKKVMRGLYPKIPNIYSQRMSKIIDKCLQLDAKNRSSAEELLKMMEDNNEQNKRSRVSSINLLNTIRMPKNIQSWKNQLPKSDYESQNQSKQENIHPKYGNISQDRLKEIIRLKNQENLNNILKKQAVKRINPELSTILRQQEQKGNVRRSQLEVLPKIKVYSEPSDKQKLTSAVLKLRDQQRKKIDYNRPIWWG